jgi:hypothetical protein
MNAKDTIIKVNIVNMKNMQQKSLDTFLTKQAETSFNAGVNTIVDWIKSLGLDTIQIDWKSMQSDDKFVDIYKVYPEDLKAKLKELGVEK